MLTNFEISKKIQESLSDLIGRDFCYRSKYGGKVYGKVDRILISHQIGLKKEDGVRYNIIIISDKNNAYNLMEDVVFFL